MGQGASRSWKNMRGGRFVGERNWPTEAAAHPAAQEDQFIEASLTAA